MELTNDVVRHECGHLVVAKALGFETGAIKLGPDKGGAEIALHFSCPTIKDILSFLQRRIEVLFAGAMAESSREQTIQPARCNKLLRTTAAHDFAKISELMRLWVAVHQPPGIIQCFWSPALGARLKKNFSGVARFDDQALITAVQFLGASELAGWATNRSLLAEAPLSRIGLLPLVLKHRPEAEIVEQWQSQLWLGLRVMASIGPGPLRIEPHAITQTLNLWLKNIVGVGEWPGTKERPDTTSHRINVSMVK